MWNDDKEMFHWMKEKLYTPVVGDILDQMEMCIRDSIWAMT